MKNLTTIISVFITSVLFGQNLDSLTFSYINQYRLKNDKKPLMWSDELYRTSTKHSNDMIINDSMYHSHGYTYSENVTYSKNSGLLVTDGYKVFMKKYYNLSCEDVLKDLNIFCATITVYNWSMSKNHNNIMLSDGKYGAVCVIMKNVVKKNNIIFDVELYKGSGNFYYKLMSSKTFQIK